ncbi:MAG TPA: DUF423 domain-containing protein [Bacteroidota bacterium]|nr:DUF423 domain-containing protein [Bacteroidota bacterium]
MIIVKTFIIIGSLSALIAVALGAFAAHALKARLTTEMMNTFEVGVRYHLVHSLAIFIVAWIALQYPDASIQVSGWLFTAGILLFSGSLYAMGITGMTWLGAITPFGGMCFLAGWAWMGWRIWKLH